MLKNYVIDFPGKTKWLLLDLSSIEFLKRSFQLEVRFVK